MNCMIWPAWIGGPGFNLNSANMALPSQRHTKYDLSRKIIDPEQEGVWRISTLSKQHPIERDEHGILPPSADNPPADLFFPSCTAPSWRAQLLAVVLECFLDASCGTHGRIVAMNGRSLAQGDRTAV